MSRASRDYIERAFLYYASHALECRDCQLSIYCPEGVARLAACPPEAKQMIAEAEGWSA